MSGDLATIEEVGAGAREILPFMFKSAIGARNEGGATRVRASERPRTLLYGPYWRLAEGAWRLRISCRIQGEPNPDLACLAVEVIAENRFLCAARDYAPSECSGSDIVLPFFVTPDLSDAGVKAMFEFRLAHLGRAGMLIERVALERAGRDAARPTSVWRLLARVRPTWRSRQSADGTITARSERGRGGLVRKTRPLVHLPAGVLVLSLRCEVDALRDRQAPIAHVVATAGEDELLVRDLFASDLDEKGRCAIPFRVPPDAGLEAGGDIPIDFALRQAGNGRLVLRELDVELPAAPVLVGAPAFAKPAILAGVSKVVIVGNCQAEMLCQGFRNASNMDDFKPKYHFVKLNPLLHEQGRRDLAACDLLLVQQISDWESYPLRADIPAMTEIVEFPCLRLASPWPFDGYNGPSDPLADEMEGEDLAFPYLDGFLARLRAEVPDSEARFAAYASLSGAPSGNFERLARFEARRLEVMDRDFDCDLGAFINENFRTARIFHTTNHPSGVLFARLMAWIVRRIGRGRVKPSIRSLDQLGNIQVPVHPRVARALGVDWAHERTFYEVRGRAVTWEQYIRSYIQHYG